MRVFILKILSLFVVSIFILIGLKVITRNNFRKNYVSGFVDKLKILETYRSQQKIVLIGGSSVGWGISASEIEAQTGIKTINLGHHAGFGLMDFEDFILKQLSRNDIVIFSPEWDFFSNPYEFDKGTLEELITNNREYGYLVDNNLYKLEYLLFHDIHFNKSYALINTPYRYACFNSNGDIISHCNLQAKKLKTYSLDSLFFNEKEFFAAFKFIKLCKTIIVFPPTQEKIYEKYKPKIDTFEKQIFSSKLVILDSAKSNVYPQSDFFDAEYHLNCETRIKRTEKIIKALRSIMLSNGR